MEAGAVATPFEYEDIGTTLAKCQRYYYRHVNGNDQAIGMVSWYNSTNIAFVIQSPVTMRTAPTTVQLSGTNYYGIESGGATFNTNGPFGVTSAHPNAARFFASGIGPSGVGYAGWIYAANASAYIALSAEL